MASSAMTINAISTRSVATASTPRCTTEAIDQIRSSWAPDTHAR